MVLSKQYCLHVTIMLRVRFPSHYGSFQTRWQCLGLLQISRFHPTMVLSKLADEWADVQGADCFHPTMVLSKLAQERSVSEVRASFHPTVVLSKRYRPRFCNQGSGSFHPTMVLSKPLQASCSYRSSSVSIPLWFFPNPLFEEYNDDAFAFPSHYGSFQTQWRKVLRDHC